mgnify:CR=1 FL=1
MSNYNYTNMKIKSSLRDYEVIYIKKLTDVADKLGSYTEKDVIIVDKKVKDMWSSLFFEVTAQIIEINATEKTKSYYKIGDVIEQLIKNGFKKTGRIVAIGGGITQDICGFISSIMFRGVSWDFFPTTLLAQGDSCIGGKTSVNFGNYKNQLGNFNPPKKIMIYSNFSETLTDSDIMSGIGEMLHFYICQSEEDFERFVSEWTEEGRYAIPALVERCLEIKKGFIERDEFDKGERLVLNYGHTFGHAIEAITDNEIPHGIAVSMGMDIANFISWKREHMTEQQYTEMNKFITTIWKDVKYPEILSNIDKFIDKLKKDKKNINENIMCVLTEGPGAMFLEQITPEEMNGYIWDYYS